MQGLRNVDCGVVLMKAHHGRVCNGPHYQPKSLPAVKSYMYAISIFGNFGNFGKFEMRSELRSSRITRLHWLLSSPKYYYYWLHYITWRWRGLWEWHGEFIKCVLETIRKTAFFDCFWEAVKKLYLSAFILLLCKFNKLGTVLCGPVLLL